MAHSPRDEITDEEFEYQDQQDIQDIRAQFLPREIEGSRSRALLAITVLRRAQERLQALLERETLVVEILKRHEARGKPDTQIWADLAHENGDRVLSIIEALCVPSETSNQIMKASPAKLVELAAAGRHGPN